MALDDVVSPDPVPTTRRSVLRTGLKLAYAAPVVAASMKLGEQAGSAQVSGTTCLPADTPCTVNNFVTCCSQCCIFPGGDVNAGVCCDFGASAVSVTQADAGPSETFVVRK